MSTTPRNRILLGALAALSALTLVACSAEDTAGTDAVAVGGTFQFHSPGGQTKIDYPVDQRASIGSISGPGVLDEQGEVALSDYAGQIVVLNAWGQWCGPCRTEVDDLQTTQEYLEPRGGAVIGINVRDTKSLAQDFITDNGLTYPSIYDPPFRTAALLGGVPASVVPTTIVLDKQHRPATIFLREITADELIEAIAAVEAEG